MDIIFLSPVYKNYIWGGNKLKNDFNKIECNYEIIAESWEIAANKNGKSLIKNKIEYNFNNLEEIFQKVSLREKVFGLKCKTMKEFPILVKFIDANKKLSIQVHPNNEYAQKNENSLGKTEMWYVMDCKENSKLICGMNNCITKEDIKSIIKNNKIEENVNYINIHKGDVIYIPAGTVHAILEGALICEVQQNCDLTYRVYDWDRVDKNGNKRELHIDKAIDVIDVNSGYFIKNRQIKNEKVITSLIKTQYFNVDLMNVENSFIMKSDVNTFYGMNVIEGNGKIRVKSDFYKITKGDSFIVPATLGDFTLEGNLKIINSYI